MLLQLALKGVHGTGCQVLDAIEGNGSTGGFALHCPELASDYRPRVLSPGFAQQALHSKIRFSLMAARASSMRDSSAGTSCKVGWQAFRIIVNVECCLCFGVPEPEHRVGSCRLRFGVETGACLGELP